MTKCRENTIIDLTTPEPPRKSSRLRKRQAVSKTDEMGCCSSKKQRVTESQTSSNSNSIRDSLSPSHGESPLISQDTDTKKSREKKQKPSPLSLFLPEEHGKPSSSIIASPISSFVSPTSANDWTSVDYVHESVGISYSIAKIAVNLLESENTIPFIARYRKSQTNGLDADQLRAVKVALEKSKAIKQKADTVIKSIERAKKWTPEIHNIVRSCTSINDLEQIHALYKWTSKRSLAEKGRDLGLGPIAESILAGDRVVNFKGHLNSQKEGLQTEEEIKESVISIIADIIAKDKRVFDKRQELRKTTPLQIKTKKIAKSGLKDDKIGVQNIGKKRMEEKADKYENYFDFTMSEWNIKPHQILAINRAESEKIITVKMTLSDHFENSLLNFVLKLYPAAAKSLSHKFILMEAYKRAFKNSIRPMIIRKAKAEMSEKAEEASMEAFAVNVKNLLLTPPVRGKVVLGVDPGYENGCKLAAVSEQGDVLETSTIYPHRNKKNFKQKAVHTITFIIRKHKCELIALGNGTACRQTEKFISDLIKDGLFTPVDVTYRIVNESGASIYSCGPEAKAEFPGMDYNVISAVSIARRLQDPLAEYVKIEPQSLGVGMYQHSLPEKKLVSKLNEVVMEAVSFVGVDVNTASQCLLRRVAGLSEAKATNIIEYRKINGPFKNREGLQKVKSIGPKTFEQCAGFIRIMPETAISKSSEIKSPRRKQIGGPNSFNLLDQTWIHPESYKIAREVIDDCDVDLRNLGTREFISAVNIFASKGLSVLAKRFNTDETTLEVIIKGLTMKKGEDFRANNEAPLFQNSLRTIDDLNVGSLLSGTVRNVVDFGAFVDIGVGKDGLIHLKNLQGVTLRLGQRVDVKVVRIMKERGRIGLILIKAY